MASKQKVYQYTGRPKALFAYMSQAFSGALAKTDLSWKPKFRFEDI